MKKKIFVIAQHDGKTISPITHELLGFAGKVASLQSLCVELVLVGNNLFSLAKDMADKGITVTLLDVSDNSHVLTNTRNHEKAIPLNTQHQAPTIQHPIPSTQNPAPLHIGGHQDSRIYIQALSAFFDPHESALICTAHTAQSMDFAPGLAVRLGAAHVSGVQDVETDKDGLNFLRAMENGKKLAWISALTQRVVLSIQPGACKPLKLDMSAAGSLTVNHLKSQSPMVEKLSTDSCKVWENIRFKGIKKPPSDMKGLSDASVVLSVGNGIGSQENLDIVLKFARLFHKCAVGGSRIVCDSGLLSHGQQVGITGAVVAPKLYMACGISGAFQHLAGMDQSEFVVSINRDPTAPMMNMADVCIVEDLNIFLPICLATLSGEKNGDGIK
ncbi:electron transfer flavoprotein subunit alpha/FixB family protein [Desulfocicer niacini]